MNIKCKNLQVYGNNADEDAQKASNPLPISAVPSLPTGNINDNTVDCVNVSDFYDLFKKKNIFGLSMIQAKND